MRIERIGLARFGEFAAWEIPDLRPGLNVLFGPNETGKSTLLGGVRFLFYGASLADYRIDGAGRQVEAGLFHDGRHWRLTRGEGRGRAAFQLKPEDAGPQVLLEQFSREWLGGVNLPTYRKVYALGLDDLDWKSEIQDLILVQADPMGQNLRDAIAATSTAAGSLLAPQAAKPINAALREWKQSADDVRRLHQRPAELRQKEEELSAEEEHARMLAAQIQELSRREAGAHELLAGRAAWEEAVSLRRRLVDLQHVAGFPPTAVADYQAARQGHEEAKRAEEDAQEQADRCRRRLETVGVDDRVLAEERAVEDLALEAQQVHDLPSRLAEAIQRADSADAAARSDASSRCGCGTTLTALRVLDTSATVESVISAGAATLAMVEQKQGFAEEEKRKASLEAERARANVTRLEDGVRGIPAPEDLAGLRRRVECVREWLRLYNEERLLGVRHEEALRRHRDLLAQRQREDAGRVGVEAQVAELQQAQQDALRAGRRRRFRLLGAGVLLLLAALAAPALGQPSLTLYLAMGGGVCLLLTALPGTQPLKVSLVPPPVTVTEPQIQEAEASARRHEAERDENRVKLSAAAAGAGLPDQANEEGARQQLRDAENRIQAAQERAVTHAEMEARLQAARDSLADAAEHLRRCEKEDDDARASAARARAAWRDLLAAHSLPEALSPEGARTFLDGSRAIQARLREHDDARAQAAAIRERLQGVRRQAEALADSLGAPLSADDPWGLNAARQWSEELKDQRTRAQERRALTDRLETVTAQVDAARTRREDAASRMREALERAQAADEDDLLRRSHDHEQRVALSDRLREVEAQLRGMRGDEAWVEMQERLEQADWVELGAASDRLREGKADHGREHEQTFERIGQLRDEIQRFGDEADLAEAQTRREAAAARVSAHARDWAAYAAAHALLSLTRQQFEHQRQPAAIQRTSALFEGLTGGRWDRVISREGSVLAGRDDDKRPVERGPDQLSRGARDALFLCARLAAIEEAVARFPLPVALDDILVNLDHERRERAIKLINALAAKTQVLLFTCHDHTVAQMKKARIAHHLVTLSGTSG